MLRTNNSHNRPLVGRSRSNYLVLAAAAAFVVAATPVFAQSTAAFTWQFQNGTTEAVLNSNTDTAVIEIYLTIDGTISGWSFFLDTSGTPDGTTQIAVSNVVTLEQASQTGSGPVNDIEDFECFAEVVDGTNSEGIPRLDPGTYLIETLTIQATGSISAASQATISFEPGQGLGYSAVADGATFYPRITTPTPLTIKWEESEDDTDDDQQTTDTDETTPDNTNNGGNGTSTDSTGQDSDNDSATGDDNTANHDGDTADENNDGDGTDDEIIDTNGDGGDNSDGSDNTNNDQANTDDQNGDEPQDETVDANSNGNGNTSADDNEGDDALGDRDVPPEIAEFCGAGSVLLMLLNLVVLMTFKLGRARTRARQGDGHNAR